MTHLRCAVYEAPFIDFPPLIVVFASSGEVLAAHPVPSLESAEALLAQIATMLEAATAGGGREAACNT